MPCGQSMTCGRHPCLSFVRRGGPPLQAVVERSGTCEYCAVSRRIWNLLIYSILLISERLGHENIETTLQIYSHLYPNRMNETMNELEKLRNSKMPPN